MHEDWIPIAFTLCFVQYHEQYLMLYRNKQPNKGKWNGLGGKIELGETPHQAIVREIEEESGLQLNDVSLRGVVSWNDAGAMYVYLAHSPHDQVVSGEEGRLAWRTLYWVLNSGQAVSNIPMFLPVMIKEHQQALLHSFYYDEQDNIQAYDTYPLSKAYVDQGKVRRLAIHGGSCD